MSIYPPEFLENMKALLGEEYDDWYAEYEREALKGVRFNRRKLDREAEEETFKRIAGGERAERVPWTDNGFYAEDTAAFTRHPYYACGLYYIQEPSAMSAAAYLPLEEDDLVLDLCAAPGGKATELASRCGFLLANDISSSRARVLLKNLELSGNENFAVTAEDPKRLLEFYPEAFDAVLVDAPCSGEGMFRKNSSLISAYRERGPEYYHDLQGEILSSAAGLLAPGGYLLYSTCTFSEWENEGSIEELLRTHPEFSVCELRDRYENFAPGRRGIADAARLFPHLLRGEGHFLCLLKKRGEKSERKKLSAFEEIVFQNKRLYRPEGLDFPKSLRFLRTGLLMGEYMKKGREEIFVPSAAAALCGRRELFDECLYLEGSDERVLRYLRGESIFISKEENPEGKKGYCLIFCDGYPFACGRLLKDRVKNIYPQGYLWQ